MKIAYFDCFSGISGDMALGALLDAGASLEQVQQAITSMGLPQVKLSTSQVKKNGFRATQLAIDHPPEHAHRHLKDIVRMIDSGVFSSRAKELAKAIFHRIAVAEAKVHGTDIQKVHFHEVGAIDSIADIVGVSVAWESLGIDIAYASPVPVGTGSIQIAHGLVSVPAPATAEILYGIPIADSDVTAELTTPTGAAILAELVTGFGPVPAMQWERIGYGAGTKDLPKQPNMLRLLIGTAIKATTSRDDSESVIVLETNLDDTTGEQIGFATELLWKAGALDVFTSPIQMKKGRPGSLLTVLVRPEDRSVAEQILFDQTGTLGIRYSKRRRTTLPRARIEVDTPWGVVRGKVSKRPDGTSDFSPEYDDCRKIAIQHRLRLALVFGEAIKQWEFTHSDSIFNRQILTEISAPDSNAHASQATRADDHREDPHLHSDERVLEHEHEHAIADFGGGHRSGDLTGESFPPESLIWPTDLSNLDSNLDLPNRLDVFPGSRSYHGSSSVPSPHFRPMNDRDLNRNGDDSPSPSDRES